MKPTISAIAAISENRVIGNENKLMWDIPEDTKYFRETTKNHPIIMGRKTFESIGVLKDRTSIVITRNKDYKVPDGCLLASSVDDALSKTKNDDEAFIIGGEEIFRQSMDIADKIYLTRIHQSFEGDAFFPELDATKWELVSKEDRQPDEKNLYLYSFLEYRKK